MKHRSSEYWWEIESEAPLCRVPILVLSFTEVFFIFWCLFCEWGGPYWNFSNIVCAMFAVCPSRLVTFVIWLFLVCLRVFMMQDRSSDLWRAIESEFCLRCFSVMFEWWSIDHQINDEDVIWVAVAFVWRLPVVVDTASFQGWRFFVSQDFYNLRCFVLFLRRYWSNNSKDKTSCSAFDAVSLESVFWEVFPSFFLVALLQFVMTDQSPEFWWSFLSEKLIFAFF